MVIVVMCYKKAILPLKLPWNGSKLPRYFNRRISRVRSTEVLFKTLAPGLTSKYKTRLKKLTCDEYSTLFCLTVSAVENKFYHIDTIPGQKFK